MSGFARQAEAQKLARLLGLSASQMDFLEKIEPAAVRRLREQATAALYDADRAAFERAAAASRLMPASLLALLAKKALGPLLCARICGYMDTDKAMDIAERLETPFLADLCLDLDPRRAQGLIAAMKPARIADIAAELAQRREYISMARFVDALKTDAIKAVLARLGDEAILHIAFYVEDKKRLDQISRTLSDARLRGIVRHSALHAAVWPEGLALMSALGEEQRARVAALAAAEDETVIMAMVNATQSAGLWAQMLPIVGLMGEKGQQRLARLAEDWDDELLLSIARSAHDSRQWPCLLGVFAQMREQAKPRLNVLARRLTPEHARALQALAKEKGLWDQLGHLREALGKLG